MASAPPDKQALLAALRHSLQEELDATRRRALDAAEAVIHEDNRPENDKDMRSTEASYIAHGQAKRAAELESALARLVGMPVRPLTTDDAVEVSALVDLRAGNKSTTYFLVVAGGGEKLRLGNKDVLTLATNSPLGEALMGLHEGEEAELRTPQGSRVMEVVRIQ